MSPESSKQASKTVLAPLFQEEQLRLREGDDFIYLPPLPHSSLSSECSSFLLLLLMGPLLRDALLAPCRSVRSTFLTLLPAD